MQFPPQHTPSSEQGLSVKLYLGCGTQRLPNFIHIDPNPSVKPDLVADLQNLSQFENDSIDLIYCCYGLQRWSSQQIPTILTEWRRVLRPGGTLRLSVPDFAVLARLYLAGQVPLEDLAMVLHGHLQPLSRDRGAKPELNAWSWDRRSLTQALEKAGFVNIQAYDPQQIYPAGYTDAATTQLAGQFISLNLEAFKPPTNTTQVQDAQQPAIASNSVTNSLQNTAKIFNLSLAINGKNHPIQMLLDPQEFTQKLMWNCFARSQLYEPEVVGALIRFLQPGDTFIDVGAHIGYYSLLASTLVGEAGAILTFEPEANNYQKIIANIRRNNFTNIELINAALGSENKTIELFVNTDNDGGHALWDVGRHNFNQKSRQAPKKQKINLSTLDFAIKHRELNHFKLLKIDTEGAELEVLKGATELITKYKIPYIICEVNRFGLEQMGTNETQLRSFMESHGYSTYLLTTQSANPIPLLPGQYCETTRIFNVLFAQQPLL